MTRVKLDTPAFADQSVDTRTIKDGTIIAQDVSGSISNDKLANSSISVNGSSVSLGGSLTTNLYLDWQAVTVADGSTTLSAVAGRGYFLDTNTGVIEVFLPTSPSRGDTIALADYSGTFATNKLIINTGGQLIDSTQGPDFKVETNNAIVELVYIDANKGWQVILNQAAGTTPTVTGNELGGGYDSIEFISATGGTVTTSGNFKIHTFTGDGNFIVANVGNSGVPTLYRAKVDYLVVAGGGGGSEAGGGAGGFRESDGKSGGCYSASPLKAACGALTIEATTYPITVGAGGTGGTNSPFTCGAKGSNSVFSTITSTGGGAGAGGAPGPVTNGGSGGGGRGGYGGSSSPNYGNAGTGNTPPVSPSQGNPGGNGSGPAVGGGPGDYQSGGGGGATSAGVAFNASNPGNGGNGAGTGINPSCSVGDSGPDGSLRYFAGGGGASQQSTTPASQPASTGGYGGGGDRPHSAGSGAGAANTGGGGAGSRYNTPIDAGAGGKGIVIIRYKYQ